MKNRISSHRPCPGCSVELCFLRKTCNSCGVLTRFREEMEEKRKANLQKHYLKSKNEIETWDKVHYKKTRSMELIAQLEGKGYACALLIVGKKPEYRVNYMSFNDIIQSIFQDSTDSERRRLSKKIGGLLDYIRNHGELPNKGGICEGECENPDLTAQENSESIEELSTESNSESTGGDESLPVPSISVQAVFEKTLKKRNEVRNGEHVRIQADATKPFQECVGILGSELESERTLPGSQADSSIALSQRQRKRRSAGSKMLSSSEGDKASAANVIPVTAVISSNGPKMKRIEHENSVASVSFNNTKTTSAVARGATSLHAVKAYSRSKKKVLALPNHLQRPDNKVKVILRPHVGPDCNIGCTNMSCNLGFFFK